MNHTTQEPKSLYLAVELEYRREYEAAHELRTMQARIADLEAQLYAIGAGGVGESIKPQAQPDTAAQQEPVAWLVCSVNNDGSLKVEHAAEWREAAHEHINDAIVEYEAPGAGSWIVRPAYTTPQPAHGITGGQQ